MAVPGERCSENTKGVRVYEGANVWPVGCSVKKAG